MTVPAGQVDGQSTPDHRPLRRSALRAALPKYIPILEWLPNYDPGDLRSDVLSGVWLWAVAVPVALSYGALAGVPPEYGLMTAAAGLALYAVFGSSRHLKVTATSTMAVMSFAVVQPVAGADPARFLALSAALAIVVGVLLLITGVLRLGFISQFLAKPVVTGFLVGLAVTIVVGQLPKLFGAPAVEGSVFDQLVGLVNALDVTDPWTLALGTGALVVILGLRRFDRRIPGALVAVVSGIALVVIFDLTERGVAVIGEASAIVPIPGLPGVGLGDLTYLLVGSAGIVFLAAAESIATARTQAQKHKYEIDPDQELVALGASNVSAGLFSGFVVDGSLAQTTSGESSGSRTQLSSLVLAGLVLITGMFLVWMFQNLPLAVLGAIVISSVIRLIRVDEVRRYWRWRRADGVLAIITMLGVLTTSLVGGLVFAILISIALLLYRASRPYVAVLGRLPHDERLTFGDVARHPEAEETSGLLLVRLDAPLYFFNVDVARAVLLGHVEGRSPRPSVVVVDVGATGDLDVSTVEMLSQLLDDLHDRDCSLVLAQVKGATRDRMQVTGLMQRIGEEHVYASVAAAFSAEAAAAAARDASPLDGG